MSDEPNFFKERSLYDDPYGYYESLRAQCPVHREPHKGVFMITGHEEALAIYNDAKRFSSCNAVAGPFAKFPVPLVGDDVSPIIDRYRDELPFSDQLPTFDPPKHTAHRALLMRLITPKRLRENEAFMWRLADREIDKFHDRGTVEFIHEYATSFTLLVIADLLGVPEADHEVFRKNYVGVGEGGGAISHKPLEFLYELFTDYIDDRRRSPRDDVMTGMATATFPDGSTPDAYDVALIAGNLFAAGQETTVRLFSAAMIILAEDQRLQQRLRDDRSLISNFVEETLRVESPIQSDFRLSRVATNIGGVDIPAGSTVMLLNGAANRDTRVFDDPATFDIDRKNARHHVAFGQGIHTCAGAPLARSEARISLERLLDRLGDIRISDAHHGRPGARRFDYLPTYMLRGVQRLHLEFTPLDTPPLDARP
jgi:cytochrome P450 family 150 subfamily A5